MQKEHAYTIRVVAEQSGLSQHIIRMWERRYTAVNPKRTETNRRLYSAQDIEKLRLLRVATAAGHNISRIAHLSIVELRDITSRLSTDKTPIGGVEVLSQRTNWAGAEEFLHKSLQCVERFNDRELRKILLQASVHLSLPDLMDKLIAPFMMKVGENWQNGSFRIAHEHLATAVVKWFLAHLRSADDSAGFSPAAIVATPAGQLHEIGALMASMTAMSEGWNTVYLGTDLPVQEIALAALEKKARAILLSLIYPVDDPFMADEIQKLSGLLHDKTTIIVGGQAAKAYKNKLSSSRTIVLESLSEFREQLRELRQQIQP